MTQAINLANFANNLDTSGGVNPTALNAVVPIAKGGTNASTVATARANLDVPTRSGTDATGSWNINSATSTKLQTTNFIVEQVGTDLVIRYNTVIVATISSTGVITSLQV